MMKPHLLFALVIGSLLVTCKGEDYSHEIGVIDSLKTVLDSTDSLINSLNRSDISKRGEEITNNSKFIQFNVNRLKDTLDFSTALLLTEYRKTGETYKKMETELKRLNDVIDSARIGLDNLKHDLSNHSLAENVSAGTSVQHESTQVFQIRSYAEDLAKSLESTRRSYDTLLPKVNSFVNKLNTQTGPDIPNP
jgi:hypothetical protein